MPTRIEVLQAMHARDEFQERDISIILDYLEQEAASSSATRTEIEKGQRRVEDGVSPRELESIRAYVAELGIFAVSKREFERTIRSRDELSRRTVNRILDLIDNSLFTIPGSPVHWFDGTDVSTLFQDVAGLTPVADNDPVGRINNKGSDGTNVLQSTAGFRPLWREDEFGVGLSAIEFDGVDDTLLNTVATGFPNGDMQIMAVFAKNLDPSTTEYMHSWDPFQTNMTAGAGAARQGIINLANNTIQGLTVMPVNEVVAMIGREEGDDNQAASFSWTLITTPSLRTFTSSGPADSDTFAFGGFDGVSNFADYFLLEWAAWTFTTGPPPTDIKNYVFGKYGVTVPV